MKRDADVPRTLKMYGNDTVWCHTTGHSNSNTHDLYRPAARRGHRMHPPSDWDESWYTIEGERERNIERDRKPQITPAGDEMASRWAVDRSDVDGVYALGDHHECG